MLTTVLTLALMFLQQTSNPHVVLWPEDKQVSLTGRILLIHGYGPPGWGEDPKHDAHITYWVIDLPAAINTPCKPERPEWEARDCQSTKQLRLIVGSDAHLLAEAKAARDRMATASGILHRQDTAGEITPIYMDVTDIKPQR
jgi:hypothetical protein